MPKRRKKIHLIRFLDGVFKVRISANLFGFYILNGAAAASSSSVEMTKKKKEEAEQSQKKEKIFYSPSKMKQKANGKLAKVGKISVINSMGKLFNRHLVFHATHLLFFFFFAVAVVVVRVDFLFLSYIFIAIALWCFLYKNVYRSSEMCDGRKF